MPTVMLSEMVKEKANACQYGVYTHRLLVSLYSLSPATSLTKICMVSPAAAEEARDDVDETDETLLERCMLFYS